MAANNASVSEMFRWLAILIHVATQGTLPLIRCFSGQWHARRPGAPPHAPVPLQHPPMHRDLQGAARVAIAFFGMIGRNSC